MPLQTAMNSAVPALQPAFSLSGVKGWIKAPATSGSNLAGGVEVAQTSSRETSQQGHTQGRALQLIRAAHRHPTAIGLRLQQEIGSGSAAIDRQTIAHILSARNLILIKIVVAIAVNAVIDANTTSDTFIARRLWSRLDESLKSRLSLSTCVTRLTLVALLTLIAGRTDQSSGISNPLAVFIDYEVISDANG